MITTKEKGLVDELKLEGNEITAFIKFLKMEKHRHEQDITDSKQPLSFEGGF